MSILDSELTKIVYIGPPEDGRPGRVTHLAGPNAGREGVWLETEMKGHVFGPVHLLVSEGAKQDGATFLRSIRGKREFDLPITIEGRTMREFYERHDAFWRSVETDRPGHFATFTRFAGWQYTRVQLDSDPEPLSGVDPSYEYAERYLVGVTAMDPAYFTFDEESFWQNELGVEEGTLRLRNPSLLPMWPRYTMKGPGRWWVEDPLEQRDQLRMLQTPELAANEELRIDTHPRRPTARLYSPGIGFNGRNVWGQLGGRRWLRPVKPRSSRELVVRVEGGNVNSWIIAHGSPRGTRPY